MVDTGTDLADRFAPDWVIEGCEVQVAIRCMNRNPKIGTCECLNDFPEACRIVEPVITIREEVPACIPGSLDAMYPFDIVPHLGGR